MENWIDWAIVLLLAACAAALWSMALNLSALRKHLGVFADLESQAPRRDDDEPGDGGGKIRGW